MRIRGSNNIQAGGDVVFQIISELHGYDDVHTAIPALHKYLDSLQLRKGLIDARIMIAIAVGLMGIAGYALWNIWSPFLFSAAIVLIFIGSRNRIAVSRLDVEITATNLVLVELYKQKISQQVNNNDP